MDVPKNLLALWKRNLPDIPTERIRAFYQAYHAEGNVILAVENEGEVRLTRGIAYAGAIVGMVNRVPCRLHLDDDESVTDGYYLCGIALDEAYRGRGLCRAMIDNACADASFAGLIPTSRAGFEIAHRLGFRETARSPFPFMCERALVDAIGALPVDYATIYAAIGQRKCDGYTFGGEMTMHLLRTLPLSAMHALTDESGRITATLIYDEIGENQVKIYDLYSEDTDNAAIRNLELAMASSFKPKAMIRGLDTLPMLPAFNNFGEY